MTASILSEARPVGVLLAAGRGRRMGGTKQLVPWPDASGRPLVACSFDAIAPPCLRMVVVLGHERERVEAALAPRRFDVAEADPDAPMIASVRAGLDVAWTVGATRPALLHPGDHPRVAPDTVARILHAALDDPACAVVPTFDGRGGHPIVVPPALRDVIASPAADDGLHELWRARPDLVRRIPVDDPTIVRDVDRPEDLEAP